MTKIYQGEPVSFTLSVKNGDGQYIQDLSGYSLEALIVTPAGEKKKGWKTSDGSISVSTMVIGEETAGVASFVLTGDETARFAVGTYTVELARVMEGGRAIGVAKSIITVEKARISQGI